MAICKDPRHDEPCSADDCSECMAECSTEYWFEDDGTPWNEVGLSLTAQGQQTIEEE
jgi:hypothetical protein